MDIGNKVLLLRDVEVVPTGEWGLLGVGEPSQMESNKKILESSIGRIIDRKVHPKHIVHCDKFPYPDPPPFGYIYLVDFKGRKVWLEEDSIVEWIL